MGWKSVKDYYRIEHTVHVTDDGICIGSPYIHNLIVVDLYGNVTKRYDSRANEDLNRYQAAFAADPAKLRELVQAKDVFKQHLPVFTFKGGMIVETACEEYGWPNVTHDGQVMYANTYSNDRKKVLEWAKKNAAAGIKSLRERISDIERDLGKARDLFAREESNLANLVRETLDTDPSASLDGEIHKIADVGYVLTNDEKARLRSAVLAALAGL